MYTSFFGLNEKPFAITPDPRYLFMSERHGEGLAHLLYGVTDSGGFIQLTGEVGTGKTTLVRTLLGQLPDEVDVALILNPRVTVLEFLQAICRELGIDTSAAGASTMALVDALNRFLLDAHANGRRIILLVDEAQNLSAEVLEQLRLLTNLETAKQKLLQIILIGQPELRDVLAQNNLRQLAQRVTGRYHLEPLSRDEAARYIEHRVKVAGGIGDIFDDGAKREAHRLSGGVPRLINVICDRALLGAYSRESRKVDRTLVRRASREVSGEPVEPRRGGGWRRAAGISALGSAMALAIVIAIAIAAGYGIAQLDPDDRVAEAAAVADTIPEPEIAAAFDPTNQGVPEPPATSASLADRLLDGSLDSSPTSAMVNLLSMWGVEFSPARGGGCAQAAASGLSCLEQRGSLGILEQLDRPAILTLTDSAGRTHEALLKRIDGDRVTLRFGDVTADYPVAEVSSLWFGRYVVVWRPNSGNPRAILPGSRGRDVVWLRESLAALSGDEALAGSGSDLYDAELEQAVRAFQRDHRLQVDGLAGEQTQIIINSALARESTPRLSGDT